MGPRALILSLSDISLLPFRQMMNLSGSRLVQSMVILILMSSPVSAGSASMYSETSRRESAATFSGHLIYTLIYKIITIANRLKGVTPIRIRQPGNAVSWVISFELGGDFDGISLIWLNRIIIFLNMSAQFPYEEQQYPSSPSFPRQFTKKYDLIQKIQKLGVKPKSKYQFSQVNESPKSPSNNQYQQHPVQSDFAPRRSPKSTQNQNEIINNLKSELLNIKQDVSKLMGKEKERNVNTTQSIKNQRISYSPTYNDNESLMSENVALYRYKNKNDGFRLRSEESNRSQEYQASLSGYEAMSQVPSFHKRKQPSYKQKLLLSPKISTMDYIDIDKNRAFKKSPKAWEMRGIQTSMGSVRSNAHYEELLEAQKTIKYLEGVIEDSNSIRRGLESKISTMKKFELNSNSQQCRALRERLSKQHHSRKALEQKIQNLTEEIQSLQQQMQSPRSSTGKSRVLEEVKSAQVYETKIKNLVESHNRQIFGLKTQNKLYKLNIEKYQLKEKEGKLGQSPKRERAEGVMGVSKERVSVLVKPHKRIVSFVNIEMQTELGEQIQEQQQMHYTNSKQCQTDQMAEIHLLDQVKQETLSLRVIKQQNQLKNLQLKKQNTILQSKLDLLTNQFQNYKTTTKDNAKSRKVIQQQLNFQLATHQATINDISSQLLKSKHQLNSLRQQKGKLADEKEQEKQQIIKQKSENVSQLKVNQQIINQLNRKIVNLQEQLKTVENKLRQQINDKKNQISTHIAENRRLTELYTEKCREGQNNKSLRDINYQNTEQKNHELSLENQRLQSKVQELEYQYRMEQAEHKQLKSIKSLPSINNQSYDKGFDESLKQHLSQIQGLKQQIEQNKQLIIQLKQQCRSLRSLADSNRAELEIEKLRFISERKNLSIGYEIEIQNIKNQLSYQKKASNSISTKLKLFNQENKRKDEFLQKYILGKNISEEFKVSINEFFRRYEEEFSIDRLKERIYSETEMIERLMEDNKTLIRNICELKEQAVRGNKVWEEVVSYQCLDDESESSALPRDQMGEERPEQGHRVELEGQVVGK